MVAGKVFVSRHKGLSDHAPLSFKKQPKSNCCSLFNGCPYMSQAWLSLGSTPFVHMESKGAKNVPVPPGQTTPSPGVPSPAQALA